MDHRRRREGRGEKRSSFNRARDRFDRKRKNGHDPNSHHYHSASHDGGRGGYGMNHNGYNDNTRGDNNYHDDNNRGGGRQRHSRSPNRWERGKKQQKKTQPDVPPERELFVGNIPSDIDESFLLHFLNGAMRHAKICPPNEAPCMAAQVNAGSFAFVEMVNADYADKCMSLNGILFLNTRIKVGRPKKYSGASFTVNKTWQEITGDALTVDAGADSEAEKVKREIFVGNTTPEMTDQMLKDFLGTVMGQVGLSIMDGNPITTCDMFGKYAFIELRTPRETTNALNLNNIEFMSSKLQITRPAKYQGVFEEHMNWEQVLARYGVKPEEFQLGQVLNSTALLTSSAANAEPIDGENIQIVKAELVQVKRALEIVRHQLEECSKKSEARKEQLIGLNKKWSEGKSELNDHRHELDQVRDELQNKSVVNRVTVDMDSRVEVQLLKKKHEETQGMLRGVTESLLKATEKLQNERKARKNLEEKFKEATFSLNLRDGNDTGAFDATTPKKTDIDFASLRAEMSTKSNNAISGGMKVDNNADTGDMEVDTAMEEDEQKMDSLKDFLAKTPKTNIDWGANAPRPMPTSSSSTENVNPGNVASMTAPRRRDRSGVRICRLLIKAGKMPVEGATVVQSMAGKYNLGGLIKTGTSGMIVVEGLEFNCDIFMDNLERQKHCYTSVGKVSERSGRSFPMKLTILNGESSSGDFSKACELVGLKDELEAALNIN